MKSVGKMSRISAMISSGAHEVLRLDPPYRWGGSDPKHGMDCSGFVLYVLSKAGFVGSARTADALCETVFTETDRQVAISLYGGYADRLSAFFYPVSGAKEHVALSIGSHLVADADINPTGITMPSRIDSDSDSFLNRIVGAVASNDYALLNVRFWQLADLLVGLYTYRTTFGLTTGDFADVIDYLGSVTVANSHVVQSPGNMDKVLATTVSLTVVQKIFMIFLGMHEDAVRLLGKTFDDVSLAATIGNFLSNALPAGIGKLLAVYAKVASLVLGGRYSIKDIWQNISLQLFDDDAQSQLADGVKVRYWSGVGDTAWSAYTKRYLSPSVFDDFLDLDVQTLVSQPDSLPRIPVKF